MNTGESAGDLLAEGAEALLEAAFRTGDYTIADTKLRQAQAVATDRATEAAVADRLGWLLHFHALDHDRDTSRADDERALFQQALIPLFTLMTDAVIPPPRSEATNAAVSANSWMVGRLRSIEIETSITKIDQRPERRWIIRSLQCCSARRV